MSCNRQCFDKDDEYYGHEDCGTCPGHDCSQHGCAICRPPKKSVEVLRLAIRCDNPPCDYSVEVTGDDFPSYLDKLCPKCQGANVLLTAADVEAHRAMVAMVALVADNIPVDPNADMKMATVRIKDGEITEFKKESDDVESEA